MLFEALGASDARLIGSKLHRDDRGGFMRTWCAASFAEAGIAFTPMQGNSSATLRKGSVRGMHFQREPVADAKVVRCSRGRIHDVVVDLRPGSPVLGQAFATELSADEARFLFIPAGFAHGFQTLSDDVVVEYLMGAPYVAELADGFRHDDPTVTIAWPEPVTVISEADRNWDDLAARLPHLKRSAPPHG